MVSPGGGDEPGDKRPKGKSKSILKTNRRFARNETPLFFRDEVPSYLRSLVSPSEPSTIRETPSSPQDPWTPPTSLLGPITQPTNPPQQENLPVMTASPPQPPVPPPIVGSSRPSPMDQHASTSESSPTADCNPSSSTTNQRLAPRNIAARDAVRDANNKFVVELTPRHEFVDQHFAALIISIFQQYPQAVAWQFKMFPESMIEKFWQEFKKSCVWEASVYPDAVVRKAFVKKARGRYKDMMNQLRMKNKMPDWCTQEIWDAWWRAWNSPEFKRSSERGKKQRAGKSGKATGTHTGGSVSHFKTKKIAEKILGKELTLDQFFLLAHTKEQDGVTFVNDRCRETQERYENLVQVQNGAEVAAAAIDEIEAFYEAAGGVNREGRIFGLGSAASQYYNGRHLRNSTSSATFSASSSGFGASSSGSNVDINEIRSTLQTVQERIEGFNSERTSILASLHQVTEQQVRMNEGLHLRANASDVTQLQERLTELEANIGPSISRLQSTLDSLKSTVERLECNSNSSSGS